MSKHPKYIGSLIRKIGMMSLLTTLSFSTMSHAAKASNYNDENDKDSGNDACPYNHQRPNKPQYSTLDLNDDSSITLEEFQEHRLPHGDHQTVFTAIDINQDGLITQEEFENHRPPHRDKKRRDKPKNKNQ